MKNKTDNLIPANKQMVKNNKENVLQESEPIAQTNLEENNVCRDNISKKLESKKQRGKNPDFINDWNKK